MSKSNQQEKFLQLRKQFPFFAFEKQDYSLSEAGLNIQYTFSLAGIYQFYPKLFFPRKTFFLPDEEFAEKLDHIVFNIGLIELISYWKAACPPTLIIRPFSLSPAQVHWWKNLYFHGLGEFFYLNSIAVSRNDFIDIEVSSQPPLALQGYALQDALIIPVGGGKDSAVTMQLLGSLPGSIPFLMNPGTAGLQTIQAMGFGESDMIEVRRTIDPELLRLNDLGFLNGHTPFSALLAFITILAAILSGRRHIALSNESSANEPTIEGSSINHQYSKSFAFESGFREYINTWVSKDFNYFSFLRPLNELQIARLFALYPQYHPIFRSCNAGSKTGSWCGKCAKCLFTYIILSPFLLKDELSLIFGSDLLDDHSLIPVLNQLCGLADEKPFDCVGTIDEVNLALCETIRRRNLKDLPALLRYYQGSSNFISYYQRDLSQFLQFSNPDHHLLNVYKSILNTALDA